MSEEVRQKMAAYAKQKEGSRRRDESEIEAIRWHFTQAILEHHPSAEFQWFAADGVEPLQVQVRLGNYGWAYNFGRNVFDAPGHEMSRGISCLLEHMELDPIREMFEAK